MTKTNAASIQTVSALLQVTQMESPRFASFTTTLAGEVQKGVRRGDHTVQMVVVLGADYLKLVQRSLDTLNEMVSDPVKFQETLTAMASEGVCDEQKGTPVTYEDFKDALNGTVRGRKGLMTSYQETLAGTNEDYTLAGYMEPLSVDGQTVAGAMVYTGPEHSEDPRAPQPGSMYLKCLVISQKVITPSANGSKIPSKSGAVMAIKNWLEDRLDLPVCRFRTVRLQKGDASTLKIGKSMMEVDVDGTVTVS